MESKQQTARIRLPAVPKAATLWRKREPDRAPPPENGCARMLTPAAGPLVTFLTIFYLLTSIFQLSAADSILRLPRRVSGIFTQEGRAFVADTYVRPVAAGTGEPDGDGLRLGRQPARPR